jgi:hypothetical protein
MGCGGLRGSRGEGCAVGVDETYGRWRVYGCVMFNAVTDQKSSIPVGSAHLSLEERVKTIDIPSSHAMLLSGVSCLILLLEHYDLVLLC